MPPPTYPSLRRSRWTEQAYHNLIYFNELKRVVTSGPGSNRNCFFGRAARCVPHTALKDRICPQEVVGNHTTWRNRSSCGRRLREPRRAAGRCSLNVGSASPYWRSEARSSVVPCPLSAMRLSQSRLNHRLAAGDTHHAALRALGNHLVGIPARLPGPRRPL